MPKVAPKNLLLIAGFIWLAAGINIAVIGIRALVGLAFWPLIFCILGSVIVGSAFHVMFGKITRKNVIRITTLTNARESVLKFFDARGYLIMAFMMTLGMFLRFSGIVPDWFIAFFYTGLGLALAGAGLSFLGFRRYGASWNPHSLAESTAAE